MSSPVGDTVRGLRKQYDLTTAQVATLARLPVDRVAAIESGEEPSVRELACIAGALGTDPAIIFSGKVPSPTRTVARFRSPLGIPLLTGLDARLLARAAEAGRICADLQDRLQRPSKIGPSREIRKVTSHPPFKEGYGLGASAREKLGIPGGPLFRVQRTLEDFGVHIAFVAFQTRDIEAASLFESKAAPVILLNSRVQRVREILSRRAVLSHELCHLLHDGGQRELAVVSRHLDDSDQEQRAAGFAPNFLAPKKDLRKDERLEVLRDRPREIVLRIATVWGLTFGGAVWHAKNTQLIDADTAEQLQRTPHVAIDATPYEPKFDRTSASQYGLEVEATSLSLGLLSDLALAAFDQGLISRARAAEVLTIE